MCIHYDAALAVSEPRPESTESLLQLCSARSLDRIHVLCSWALSPDPALRRLAVAIFAVRSTDLGAPTALSHLADDPIPSVRRLVAAAARAHRDESPAYYSAILRRLSADPDPTVRQIANAPRTTPT